VLFFISNAALSEIVYIGRREEKELLLEGLSSAEAEMIAVIGRRRVGKKTSIARGLLRRH